MNVALDSVYIHTALVGSSFSGIVVLFMAVTIHWRIKVDIETTQVLCWTNISNISIFDISLVSRSYFRRDYLLYVLYNCIRLECIIFPYNLIYLKMEGGVSLLV